MPEDKAQMISPLHVMDINVSTLKKDFKQFKKYSKANYNYS